MKIINQAVVRLENAAAFLEVDSFGGAITSFQLNGSHLNPLNFRFSKEQMPANNRAGASYQGHFSCIGRWGEPSAGEIAAGVPNHGEPANIAWQINQQGSTRLSMHTTAAREGLAVTRSMELDAVLPAFCVVEKITNRGSLGRMLNIVQHPTIAPPFLDAFTIVNSNASRGFAQQFYRNAEASVVEWPAGKDSHGSELDLQKTNAGENILYSFVVSPGDKYGWITAYSPSNGLVLGYLWKRADYSWIHIWQHYNEKQIQYLGIEFGTAGIHQPFDVILNTAPRLFGEKTVAYLDAGETMTKSYVGFSFSTGVDFCGVDKVVFSDDTIIIQSKGRADDIIYKLTKEISRGLQQ
jgi:hypothetical protein